MCSCWADAWACYGDCARYPSLWYERCKTTCSDADACSPELHRYATSHAAAARVGALVTAAAAAATLLLALAR